jgi:hypothetical protein
MMAVGWSDVTDEVITVNDFVDASDVDAGAACGSTAV